MFFYVSLNSVLLLQTQEGRAGEAHVSAAGEQTGADGAAGGTHEAAKGKTVTCFCISINILQWCINTNPSS